MTKSAEQILESLIWVGLSLGRYKNNQVVFALFVYVPLYLIAAVQNRTKLLQGADKKQEHVPIHAPRPCVICIREKSKKHQDFENLPRQSFLPECHSSTLRLCLTPKTNDGYPLRSEAQDILQPRMIISRLSSWTAPRIHLINLEMPRVSPGGHS